MGYIVHSLQSDSTLQSITHPIHIFQAVTPKPASRDTFLREAAAKASASDNTYVLVMTSRLVAVRIDIVFYSYIVQLGEIFSNREREQFIGHVHQSDSGWWCTTGISRLRISRMSLYGSATMGGR